MRKRAQYRKDKLQTKVSTLIIMIIMLIAILAFGKNASQNIAAFFVPNVPVTDTAAVAVPDLVSETTAGTVDGPKLTGSVLANANKSAAQNLLKVLSNVGHP